MTKVPELALRLLFAVVCAKLAVSLLHTGDVQAGAIIFTFCLSVLDLTSRRESIH